MIFVCKIRGVFQTALLEHIPNFNGHLRFNLLCHEAANIPHRTAQRVAASQQV